MGLCCFPLISSLAKSVYIILCLDLKQILAAIYKIYFQDVVGRGIDVPEIDLVVQYSPPQKTADFVHRVGRTARAGRSGRAILFLTPSEVQFVRYLENKRIRYLKLI